MIEPQVHALIPAAGRSVRFGGTMLKQYTHLMGQAVMAHSIAAVRKHPAVKRVTVALAPDDGIYDDLIRPAYPDVATVTGGDSRAQTVMNGLRFIRETDPACEWVLVHDAARPCLSGSSLDDLLTHGLASESGAILAVPVSDTLKLADENGFIVSTVDRTRYWSAQTPQLFRLAFAVVIKSSPMTSNMAPRMRRMVPARLRIVRVIRGKVRCHNISRRYAIPWS